MLLIIVTLDILAKFNVFAIQGAVDILRLHTASPQHRRWQGMRLQR